MAPELLKGLGPSAVSDVFSLGTLLYVCAYRHPLLLGLESPSLELVGQRQIEVMPPLLCEVDASIPEHVARFVERALAKRPEARFASMAELGRAARAALEQLRAESAELLECRELSGVPFEVVAAARSSAAPRVLPPPRPRMPGVPVASLKRPGEATQRSLADAQAAANVVRVGPSLGQLVLAVLAGSAIILLGVVVAFAFFDGRFAGESTPVTSARHAAPPVATRAPVRPEPERPPAVEVPPAATRAPQVEPPRATPRRASPAPLRTPPSARPRASASSDTAMDERLEWLRNDLGKSAPPPAPAPAPERRSSSAVGSILD
jgi:hypothetical protein